MSKWKSAALIILASLLTIGLFIFGPSLLFLWMRGPDRLLERQEAKRDFIARQEFIERYKSVLGNAREAHDVALCNALPVSINFYQTNAEGDVQYYPDYSGGPLIPGNMFSLPRFDCVRAYAVDFTDVSACEKGELNDIQFQLCLMEVGLEMRRQNDPGWQGVCESIKTRDESGRCKQEVINPEKENLEIPEGLRED